MNRKTAGVFRELMKRGYVDKDETPELFAAALDEEVTDELDTMKREFEFELYRSQRRLYLVPNQENELFLQDNSDFKRSVGTDAKLDDIYLYNYLAVFILHSMFGGKGNNLETRNMFVVSDMIQEFSEHCRKIKSETQDYEAASEKYSIEFINIAEKWLSKLNDVDNNKLTTMNGTIMKVIRKLRDEELIYESEPNVYKPTQKLRELMPCFLSQQRVAEVNSIFEGGNK